MSETIRQKQKKATREKILRIATEQFATHGFLISTNDISKAAGLSHGSIFLHFSTKEDLVDCVIKNFFDQLNTQIDSISKDNSNITDLLYAHLSILSENEQFYIKLITQLSLLSPNIKNTLFAYQSTLSFHFEQILSKEIEKGLIIPISFHMIFNMWLALLHYYLQNSTMFSPEGSVIKRYKDELIRSYLMMIQRH